ncbi:MAG: tail fiber domain-containing protein [Flavobacterium sp.]|nr:tail fiber domain-containing protein [Flavobacterium sp.]
MKTLLYTVLFLGFSSSVFAQVGIGTTTPQGALDIVTVAGAHNGLLIPRVPLTIGTTNALPLVAPTVSEMIYNTSTVGGATPGFYFWNGTSWVRFVTGAVAGWLTTGNAGLTAGTNFIGTTDAVDVSFKRGNVLSGYIGATSTAFGVGALSSGAATTSTAFGNNALSVSTGANNVAFGQNALRDCAGLATYNTAVGANALKGINNAASQYNTVVGGEAMGLTTGDVSNCTAVGYQALNSISGIGAARGINNTAVGYQAGNTITTGTNNIVIGYQAQVASATTNNQIQIGNSAISLARCQVAWTLSSDQRFKNNIKDSELGLQFLQTLRPVSYLRSNDTQAKTEYGFIAQELQAAFEKAGASNNGVISSDDAGKLGVRYNDFISISVKAIQEQQLQIEALQQSNVELQKTIAAILERLAALERKQ